MTRYIAFLRGINVGGHRVRMAHLRELFEELGFENVSSFIASGNVSFTADTSASEEVRQRIEAHLETRLGYDVPVFLRTPAELAEVTAFRVPGEATQGTSDPAHYVIFLHEEVTPALRSALADLESETDRFHFAATEVHWLVQGKLSESPLFGTGIERATKGFRTTMRNLNTLRRIAAREA